MPEPPVSLHDSAINLSLLQSLTFQVVWPYCALVIWIHTNKVARLHCSCYVFHSLCFRIKKFLHTQAFSLLTVQQSLSICSACFCESECKYTTAFSESEERGVFSLNTCLASVNTCHQHLLNSKTEQKLEVHRWINRLSALTSLRVHQAMELPFRRLGVALHLQQP